GLWFGKKVRIVDSQLDVRDAASGRNGGGLYAAAGLEFANGRLLFENCRAKMAGGGVFSGSDIVLIGKALTLRRCITTGAGGGIYVAAGSLTRSGPSQVEDCYARGGGDIAFVQGNITLAETVITGSSRSLHANGHVHIDTLNCARASSACYVTGHANLVVARAATCPRGAGFYKLGIREG
ncbi:unnamed protein product, partial [Symbiodinium pilosum]